MTIESSNLSAWWPRTGAVFLIAWLLAAVLRADELADRADVIKPNAKELMWLKIPWELDLMAAQETARKEERPIFLWVTGDDPLGRC
jgi:hypothetical protein